MTQLLDRAIAKLKTLSAIEQDAIASIILEELEEDLSWEKSFVDRPERLAKTESSAIDKYRAFQMQEMNF